MADIEIKRGYEVLPDNNVRFGIRVINNSDFAISDVEVILDYSESLFDLEGNKIQKLGTIPPTVPRTAKFTLKPRGCIHKEEIAATIRYKDHQWKRHTLEMQPKVVHCVCPFLKEKSITRADFLSFLDSGYLEERGVNFEGIAVDKVVDFLYHTCKNRLYRVDEVPIEAGTILYLAGDALGEKTYYLLTAVVKEYDSVTQVLLRANSDRSHGLNGFLNEIMDNLRHLVLSVEAREIGIIKKEQVINIIDSVVQRTTFAGGEGAASVNIEGSVVQRTEIREDAEKRRQETEERRAIEEEERKAREESEKREREEHKRLRREEEERKRKEKEEQERIRREEEEKKARARKVREEQEKKAREDAERQKREEHENSIGMKFTLIPAGEFMMGAEVIYGDEKPVHKVRIEKPFYLGAYPVTQREWETVMGDNHHSSRATTCLSKVFLGMMFRSSSGNSMRKKVQTNTDSHLRLNGNTHVGLAPPQDTHLEILNRNLAIMRGIVITQAARRIRSVRRSPILGGCMTCMVMSGNGCRMSGTVTTKARQPMAARGKAEMAPTGAVTGS